MDVTTNSGNDKRRSLYVYPKDKESVSQRYAVIPAPSMNNFETTTNASSWQPHHDDKVAVQAFVARL